LGSQGIIGTELIFLFFSLFIKPPSIPVPYISYEKEP
jgi:hypothetical protein